MKILASDYDGTFHTSEEQTLRNIEAVKRWQEAGNQFGFVTGRAFNMILAPVEQRSIPYDFLICNNGTTIYSGDGALMSNRWLPMERLEELLDYPAVKKALHYALVKTDRSYVLVLSERSLADRMEFQMTHVRREEIFGLGPFCQISLEFDRAREAADCTAKINREFGDLFCAHLNISSVDITPAGVDKGSGVAEYLALAGGTAHTMLVVGDGENDLGMIRRFRGFTVENARPQVKEAAARVYRSVAELIEDHIRS